MALKLEDKKALVDEAGDRRIENETGADEPPPERKTGRHRNEDREQQHDQGER